MPIGDSHRNIVYMRNLAACALAHPFTLQLADNLGDVVANTSISTRQTACSKARLVEYGYYTTCIWPDSNSLLKSTEIVSQLKLCIG